MAGNDKERITKTRATAKDSDGNKFTYRVPDGRTWTVQHWREAGLTISKVAKQMGISVSTVEDEIKVMKEATLADFDADKIRQSLGALIPQSVQAVSKSLAAGDGQLGAKMLTGLGALRPEAEINQQFLNITGPEVLAQLFSLIRSEPEYMLLARKALLAEDSQAIQLSGPDNLPLAVQAERQRRAEAVKKHALPDEGHTPETQGAPPDIQEGSTSRVSSPNESSGTPDSFRVVEDSGKFKAGDLMGPTPGSTFPVEADYRAAFADSLPDNGQDSVEAENDDSDTAGLVSKEGGLSVEKESLDVDDLESEEARLLDRLAEIRAGKQVKRVNLEISPEEDD